MASDATIDHSRPGPRSLVAVAAAAIACQALAFGVIAGFVTQIGWYSFFDRTDLAHYAAYASDMAKGLRPYAGFFFEYPPLAARLVALPSAADPASYLVAFALLMVAATATAAAVCAVTAVLQNGDVGRGYRVSIAFGVLVVLTGAIIANRYDAAVALVLAATVLAMTLRHWRWAGLAVGIGFALKLAPLILLPLALILPSKRRDVVGTAAWCAAAALLPFILAMLPDPHAAGAGIFSMFAFHLTRPLEIESFFATPLLLAAKAGLPGVGFQAAFGSEGVVGPTAAAASLVSLLATLAALAWCYLAIWRRRCTLRRSPRALPLAALCIMLAYVVFGKVLSPQYVIWLLPLAALVYPDSPRMAALIAAAALLTQVLFPALYGPLGFGRLDALPIAVLAARNLVLLVAFGWSARLLARIPATVEG
jgi:hypothetical protein